MGRLPIGSLPALKLGLPYWASPCIHATLTHRRYPKACRGQTSLVPFKKDRYMLSRKVRQTSSTHSQCNPVPNSSHTHHGSENDSSSQTPSGTDGLSITDLGHAALASAPAHQRYALLRLVVRGLIWLAAGIGCAHCAQWSVEGKWPGGSARVQHDGDQSASQPSHSEPTPAR